MKMMKGKNKLLLILLVLSLVFIVSCENRTTLILPLQEDNTTGINQTITILKDTNFIINTYCNITFTNGKVTNTTC